MTTSVTITGSGVPVVAPGRAGPGALVRHDDTMVQVDAGRSTVLRLAEAGVRNLNALQATVITHHHSDHIVGLTDLLLTRWIQNGPGPYDRLPVHCPVGPTTDYLEHLFDNLGPDIASRRGTSGYIGDPDALVVAFDPPTTGPVHVAEVGAISIDAAIVDHGDLAPAVAYRFTTPDGVIVVSGDTRVCPAIEELAKHADVLVHEVFAPSLIVEHGRPANFIDKLSRLHADAGSVGAMAARLQTPVLVGTHMIPSPANDEERAYFEREIREAGYSGELTIADDLHTVTI